MKILSVFNNKGGVGKSTLSYHLAHALSEKGIKTLIVDLDPQSNITLHCMTAEELEELWEKEQPYIDDFQSALEESNLTYDEFLNEVRSVHCLLKPIEDGVYESFKISKVFEINKNLGLIPGRLSLHKYEDKISKSWSDTFMGEPQALRLISSVRNLCLAAAEQYGYEIAIIDTSPSLGMLNRVIISTSTGFFIPCMPDMFSTFGITNIGQSLSMWKNQFDTMSSLLSDKKRTSLPKSFVKFLGYTIYNAKLYAGRNELDIANAHYSYVRKIPNVITKNIPQSCYSNFAPDEISTPIGYKSVMHSHNTLTSMAQKYRTPVWNVPNCQNMEPADKSTVSGNRGDYLKTKDAYHAFADDLLSRLDKIEEE